MDLALLLGVNRRALGEPWRFDCMMTIRFASSLLPLRLEVISTIVPVVLQWTPLENLQLR
jgi:hypothetical protein